MAPALFHDLKPGDRFDFHRPRVAWSEHFSAGCPVACQCERLEKLNPFQIRRVGAEGWMPAPRWCAPVYNVEKADA